MARNILILGASYGSLLATKLLMAGHNVTLVCRKKTAELQVGRDRETATIGTVADGTTPTPQLASVPVMSPSSHGSAAAW